MTQFCRKLLQSALPPLMLCLLATLAQATTIIPPSDTELIVNSRFIVTGEVRSVTSAWDDMQSMVWTYVEIRRDRLLKGDIQEKTLVLKQLGGAVGLEGVHVFGQPRFSRGQQVLLYLNTGPDGSLRVAHAFIGMFSIVEDASTGRKTVKRMMDAGEVHLLARDDGEIVTDHALLEDYLHKIEATLEREASRVTEIDSERRGQPVFAAPAEYRRIKKESHGVTPSYTFIGGGVRWVEADSNQAITYAVNPDRSPVAGGGAAELGRALSAWSSQSGAKIRLQSAGQTSSCGIEGDGANTISFGDCKGQLDAPAGCSGVVALTSVRWVNNPSIVNGRAFNRLIEADLVFNRGMDCFLGNSSSLAEVACHEIGHSIGLDHSGDPGAIMWASARGGRDAVLGADDKTGVLAIYPAGGGSGGGGGDGTGGSGPVSITTLSMPEGTVGRWYELRMRATGGTPPYRWSQVSGSLPPGLRISGDGIIDGYPIGPGSYSFSVQVVDNTGNQKNLDSKRVVITVTGGSNPSILPAITSVKIKGSKKLYVYGQNFDQDALIVLNGFVLSPKSFQQDGSIGRLFFKGSLPLGASGTNSVYVQNNNSRSLTFLF